MIRVTKVISSDDDKDYICKWVREVGGEFMFITDPFNFDYLQLVAFLRECDAITFKLKFGV